MAKLSSDGTYVTVEKGDTLSEIARDYGNGLSYKQLASINNISDPDKIYVGQKIKLKGTASSTSSSSSNSNAAVIEHFGLQSNTDGLLFATWSWSKSNTDHYETEWYYHTWDDVWFVGNKSTTQDKQSTYNIPSNAKKVRFRVKPISKKKSNNGKETSYWTAEWSTYKYFNVSDSPPKTPGVPTVTLDKYKLTAKYDNLDVNATGIHFHVIKNNDTIAHAGKATISMNAVSYSWTVEAGNEYKVRARSYRDEMNSDWSDFSSVVKSPPAAPSGITTIRASSETSIYLEWAASNTATSYDLEYATKESYFDGSDQTTTISNITSTHYEKTGLETGQEYFFRVRAVRDQEVSPWSGIKSVVIGDAPTAPTTWSSTTTAITGEKIILYWVHNGKDGSSQTFAELELTIDGATETHTIKNTEDEDEKDKTSKYELDTTSFVEGTKIQWRVRTAGITKEYGDWSVERTIDVYAPPSLELTLTDVDGNVIDNLSQFPFYVKGLASPKTQAPIGYHLSITANEAYETTDVVGNVKMVGKGEEIYSKHFDINDMLLVEMSAHNIDLENNITYTVNCTVSMDSGLTAEAICDFTVTWTDSYYTPNAEINYDKETIVTHIHPYCKSHKVAFVEAELSSNKYLLTNNKVEMAEGYAVVNNKSNYVYTTTGEQVFEGTTTSGSDVYYCTVPEESLVEGVTLSVYRREYDGTFTEIATGIPNNENTFVTDPHPALDFARYRIVAVTEATGAVSYSDLAGYPIGEPSIIIQWDEKWSVFDSSNEAELEQPPWTGSLLKLPYNVNVSDKTAKDVSLVEYAGRKHPVTYYGTQLGISSNWTTEIPKSDKETLYGLRRLAIWTGDVYVREPSGSGYWANISVSYNQNHKEVKIPVTFDIVRVEGGM